MKNIYKKIIIMFIMVLGIMGIGAISNGYVANAATVGKPLTQPEEGWERIEETHNNITFVGDGWRVNSSSTESGGSNKNIEIPTKDSAIRFNFNSNKIRIIVPYNPLHNDTVELYIDNKKVDTISLNHSNSRQVLVYENLNLDYSEHIFELKVVGKGQFGIDAFDIDKDGYILPYNPTIQENPEESNDSDKTGAILIINLVDGETKVYDVTTSEVKKFIDWYDKHDKETYRFDKDVDEKISVNEYVVHDKITMFEVRKY